MGKLLMLSLATGLAAEKMEQALASLQEAKAALGTIHTAALSDGMLRHIKRQRATIDSVAREIGSAIRATDYELDFTTTIEEDVREEE